MSAGEDIASRMKAGTLPRDPADESVPMPMYHCTDTGNGERFARLHRDRARFVPAWNMWIVFDGKRWAKDPAGVRVAALAKNVVQAIYVEAARAQDPDVRAALGKWARATEARKLRESMIALARCEPGMAVEHTALDVNPWAFNCLNGTLDLYSGELREHSAGDMLTKLAPVKYDPAATCPRFVQFLSETMEGDVERVEFLRRFLGYCLTGDVREHVLTFWHGRTGGNGKSVLTDTVCHVMGDYATKAAPDLLFKNEKMDRHPTELADLYRVRLVVCNETSGARVWDEATVKDITGGDVIKARRMREDFWTFTPTHKIVVFGNNKPKLRDAGDGGMRRRLRLIPFEKSFSDNPDRKLGATLRKEAAGILRYLAEGCRAWRKDGLTEPKSIMSATETYFADEDTIGRFLTECCEFDPGARVTRSMLRKANAAWSEEADERPASPKALAKSLQDRGVVSGKVRDASGPRDGWHGVRLRDLAQQRVEGGRDQCSLAS